MKNARFWLWGLVPLLVLWFAANQVAGPAITADLSDRVAQALAGRGAGWARIDVQGRDVSIVSTAPDAAAKSAAIKVAIGVDGVRRVNEDVAILPVQAPFTWRAERKNDVLSVSGFVPSDEFRTRLLGEMARIFPGAKVEARLEIAAGAPKNFFDIVMFALGRLGSLVEGDASISDTTLAISGRARDVGGYLSIVESMKAVPKGIVIGAANVIPPTVSPYVWSAVRQEGSVTISGHAPDRATKEANAASAKQKLPGLTLVDEQTLALGQSPLYRRAVDAILDALAALESGKGSLTGDTVRLAGRASDAAAYAAATAALKAASDAGLKTEADVAAPPPPPPPPPQVPDPQPNRADAAPAEIPADTQTSGREAASSPAPPTSSDVVIRTPAPVTEVAEDCGAKVATAVSGRRVQFARSRVEVDPSSADLVRDIASALKACGKVSVAVEGHTDGEGRAANNQRLSEARAAAVRDALVAQGVAAERIAAAGFGWSRPLVPNTTRDNLARNRRVEFLIR